MTENTDYADEMMLKLAEKRKIFAVQNNPFIRITQEREQIITRTKPITMKKTIEIILLALFLDVCLCAVFFTIFVVWQGTINVTVWEKTAQILAIIALAVSTCCSVVVSWFFVNESYSINQ